VAEAFDRVLGGRPQPRIFEIRWDWGRLQRVLISFGGLLADLVVSVDAVPERGADALARDFTQTIGGGFAWSRQRLGWGCRRRSPECSARTRSPMPPAALREENIELLFPEPRAGSSGICLVLVDAGGERRW